jgi:hypothetical protein
MGAHIRVIDDMGQVALEEPGIGASKRFAESER